jgi:hypothetical protein
MTEPVNGTVCGVTFNNYTDEKLIAAYRSEYPNGTVTDIKNISYETILYLIAEYDLYNRMCNGTSYHYKGDNSDIIDKEPSKRTLSDIYNDVNRCINN